MKASFYRTISVLTLALHSIAPMRAQPCATGASPEILSMVFNASSGTATLIGHNEYIDTSSPPKKYRKQRFDEDFQFCHWANTICSGTSGTNRNVVNNATSTYDRTTGANTVVGFRAVYGASSFGSCPLPPTIFAFNDSGHMAAVDMTGIPMDTVRGFEVASSSSTALFFNGTNQCYLTHAPGGSGRVTTGFRSFQLSEEDTEEDALARATVTSAPGNVAYRTKRTTGFSFGFSEVNYSVRFGNCCPGDHNIFVVYTEAVHGSGAPGAPKRRFLEKRRFTEGNLTLSGTIRVEENSEPFGELDTDYTILRVEAEPLCANIEPGGGGGGGGSAHFWFNLGRAAAGDTAGQLRVDTESFSAATYTPEALVTTVVSSDVEIVKASGVIRQVKAPQTFADIVTLSASSYEVRFYPLDQVGAKMSGIYTLTGSPYVVHKVENPDAHLSLMTRLRVTETRGASSKVSEFSYDAGTSTWSYSQADGLRVQSITTAIVSGDTVKTTTIKNDANVVASKTARTYHAFAWGEELISEVLDPDGDALTTTYDFYDSVATSHPYYGKLRQRTDAHGDWQRYTYDAQGRVLKAIRPFLNAGPTETDEALCRVEENTYDTLSDADGDSKAEQRTTTIEYTLGVETARRYRIDWSAAVTVGGVVSKRRSDIVCVASGAAWNASGNLVTETLTYASGPFAERDRRISFPDGTIALTTHVLDGSNVTTTTHKVGEPNGSSDDVVDGTTTVSETSAAGHVASEEVTDIASGLTLSSWIATQFDDLGRPTRFDFDDGTYTTREYACCGLASEQDRFGIVTTHTYDALGRREATFQQGIITEYTYDAEGRVKTVVRIGTDDSEITLESNTYDLAGHLTEKRDALNRLTSFAESFNSGSGLLTRTTTAPDSATTIETTARDGSIVSIGGTAAAPREYEYGVESGSRYTKEILIGDSGGSPTTTEWTKTYLDFAGRTASVLYPDSATATSHYNAIGQLVRQVDPDGVTTLFGYNGRGEQEVTAIDLDADNTIDYAGDDRITRTIASVASKTDGSTYTVRRTTTEAWEADDADTPTTLSVQEQSVDGLRSWQTTHGLVTRTVTVLDGGGDRTVTTTTPDGVKSIQVFEDGRLMSNTVATAADVQLAAATYAYDPHGRLATMTDARNGATTYTYFADDQIDDITTPDPDTTQSGTGYDAQVTSHTYDSAGRLSTVTHPDGGVVTTTYWPTGATKRVSGARTYPVEYTYDPQGRVKTLTTWQDFVGNSGQAVTTWNYHATRGWLENKRYSDNTGPAYTYTPAGRLLTRTWARSGSIVTTYDYNDAGDLIETDYSDSTPDVTIAYDRVGRPSTITDGSGTRTLAYHASGQLQDETYTAGLLDDVVVTREFDAHHRLEEVALPTISTTTYGYDAASRLETVTNGVNTATYAYVSNSALVGSIVFKNSGNTRLTTAKAYDKLDRLTSITSTPTAGSVLSYAYAYNAANQRTRVTREDNGYWSFGYDPLGQVTSGKKYTAAAVAVPGLDYAWTYDDIGNRKTAITNAATTTYTANLLNQYSQRAVPGVLDVTGAAAEGTTVTVAVNSGTPQATTRQGEWFYKQITVDNSVAAQKPTLKIVGVKNLAGSNGEDAVTEITQPAFVAPATESFTHDTDGNLTADAKWAYTWDGENRLIALETTSGAEAAGVPRKKLEFAYDGMGRRVSKKVSDWNGSAWVLGSHTLFAYDGWNLLAELNALASNAAVRTYVWGLDLSGSFQGAGGVGGLVAINDVAGSAAHFAAFDGNGNVGGLTKASDGTTTGRYDYNAFGQTTVSEGAFAASNAFRFSTKFADSETGQIYFGYRCYASEIGRWPNRDPLEEPGHEAVRNVFAYEKGSPWQSASEIDVPTPDVLLQSESTINDPNDYAFIHNNTLFYIDPDGRSLRGVLEVIKLLAELELKRRAKRAAECTAIHATYKKVEQNCRRCGPGMPAADAAKNASCWLAVVAGRSLYLAKKCDYYLAGSIARGSKIAERGHKVQLAQVSAALAKCQTCASHP